MDAAQPVPASPPPTSIPTSPIGPQGSAQPARKGAVTASVRGQRNRRQIVELKLNWWQRLVFYLLVGVIHALSLIPDFILYPLGVAGGYIAWILDRRHVAVGMRNLEIAFPERSVAQRRQILRASYVNLGRSVAEYVRLGGFFHRRILKRVTYERFAYWDEIQRRYPGKGGVALTAHFGNFELLPTAHAMFGHQIVIVHHTQRFLAGDALMTFIRERTGVTIMRKHAAARSVLKALRQGLFIGIPFDQNAKRSEAVFVPFFSELAATSSGVARLVAMSGTPVVPVFIIRQPDKRSHRIEIFDEIPVQRSADAAADIEENTLRFTRAVEAMVRRYPEQFLWMHRRYRTRPRGAPQIYS
ncbi:MAG TPA: lysophospholipid acyltransferase family protein [Candidatus Binataceae bacterium]|nr:lysophospholipid acyltransferase family protein [Candidatus Binataceae bacterium]